MTNVAAPTTLVIFGPTGDLMKKKLAPALWHLFLQGALPERFRIVGFGRRPFTAETFRAHVRELLGNRNDAEKLDAFLNLLDYRQGLLDSAADYHALNKTLEAVDARWGLCSNRLFYLAVPPDLYETIFRHLAKSGLVTQQPGCGWRRVAVEKPFGKNFKTAERLDALLGKLFPEEEIYRIDHYLAKEMLQNILAFRFSNNLFESNWSNEAIEQIEIKLWEAGGVEDRGSFYDGVGALRDVGQNHLLQILALVTMERPDNFDAPAIRQKRAELLKHLRIPSREGTTPSMGGADDRRGDVKENSYRAQYEGYREISGVSPDSQTETYFRIRSFLDTPRWAGVPIAMESGKRLGEQRKEILVTFTHPSPCLCPPGHEHLKNTVRIRLEPAEGITIHFWSKKPGAGSALEERTLDFLLRPVETKIQYVEEYERLLLDCITGDQTLFVSTEEVKAMWRFTDPIVQTWEKNAIPLQTYEPGTIPQFGVSKLTTKARSVPALSSRGLKKEIGIVGLGKMGENIARRLMGKGWRVAGFNRSPETAQTLEREGLIAAYSLSALVEKLTSPRFVWVMVTAGHGVDDILFGKNGIVSYLKKGDVILEAGNSFYKDTIRRARRLKRKNIELVDVGVSGGPEGARHGAALMIGGTRQTFEKLEPLFYDLAAPNGYQFFEGAGAGHFVKMIHNGIEYGMMQAIAEGFTILKKAPYKLDLTRITDVYNHGSVIESRLIGWLKRAFDLYGVDLSDVTGSVAHTGEGAWTVKTAKEIKLKAKLIEEALRFRIQSQKNPSYTGKILSALRAQFGGHDTKPNSKNQKPKRLREKYRL